MARTSSVDTSAEVSHPLAPDALDVSALWSPSFPSADLVAAAGRLFVPDLLAHPAEAYGVGLREGPVHRITVAPGLVQVGSKDYARAERTRERADRARRLMVDEDARRLNASAPDAPHPLAGRAEPSCCDAHLREHHADRLAPSDAPAARRVVSSWSRKSRSNMVRTLASLDYAPLFAQPAEVPAMVTLTLPGDWVTVAPSAAHVARMLLALRKRFERAWSRPLVAVWKREFQRRGAPHYHLLMVPPHGTTAGGEDFRTWLSRTWVEVVGHPDAEERARHRLAGTGIDYAEGARQSDPRRFGVYFSKHGSFSDKDYQNDAPAEWAGESVGRFWGYWHLNRATATVEVTPEEAVTAGRTLRRLARSRSYVTTVQVWRSKRSTDPQTGAPVQSYYRRPCRVRVTRMQGRTAGYLVVNDGPALAATLARYLDDRRRPLVEVPGGGFLDLDSGEVRRSGSGPRGFLP